VIGDGTASPGQVSRPLRIGTKAEAAYEELRSRILDGSFEPGSTVNQEVLANSLGLSITPLREALRRLEAEELVALEAHRTMTITPLTRKELDEVYAVRLRLDPFAARLAAKAASAEDLQRIFELAQVTDNHDPRATLAANRAFHRAVYSASHNAVLVKMLDQLWNRTDRYRLILLSDHIAGDVAAQEHRVIAETLAARDAYQVEQLVEAHVASAMRLIQQVDSVRDPIG
jgi:DNA-binding GntR family transcriptional regulator